MMVCRPSTARAGRTFWTSAAALAIAALLCGVGWVADAQARPRQLVVRQPAKPKPAPLPPAEPFPADMAVKSELSVGELRAVIGQADIGAVLPVGGTVFVTVTITDPGGNKSATLLADAETGKVASINGKVGQVSPVSGGLSAEIALPAKGPVSVVVELAVKDGATLPGDKLRSRLRLTLLPQKGGKDVAILNWALADCAGDYKHELVKILDDRRARMIGTLDAVSAPETGWPAAWLFTLAKPAPAALVCKLQKGHAGLLCKPATPAKQARTDGAGPMEEARIFELASAILREKGALPQFQHHTQPLRQASFTLLSGLRAYMEQDAHPALCSGVDYMVNYYQTRTGLLRSTIDETKTALDRAKALAREHIAAIGPAAPQAAVAVQLASSAAAPAAGSEVGGELSPGGLLEQVGKATLGAADQADLAADPDLWTKLRRLKALLDTSATATLTSAQRSAAASALGMVEAAAYLSAAVPKYDRLDEAIYGTMSAVEAAHKRTCVCGG